MARSYHTDLQVSIIIIAQNRTFYIIQTHTKRYHSTLKGILYGVFIEEPLQEMSTELHRLSFSCVL